MTRRLFAILPAAGRSIRMGRPKLLLPWGETTVVESVLGEWRASRVSHVVMVVHPDDRALAEAAHHAGAEVVVPASPPPDMKASICHALSYIEQSFSPDESDGWLLAPADMPGLTTATINWMIGQASSPATDANPASDRILIPTHLARRGHPVYFPWPLAAAAFQLGANEGLNALVARNSVREVKCEDPAVLEDLDHPDDYRKLHDRYHRYTPPTNTPS